MARPRTGPPRRPPHRRRRLAHAVASTLVVNTAAARAAALARHERRVGAVLELDLDRCKLNFGATNSFGTCGGRGEPCYNTFSTCKDKAAYVKGVHTHRFCTRGMRLPPGEPMRPYIELAGISIAPAEIDPNKGLAIRSQTTVTMADEPDSDLEGDPYAIGFALKFDGVDDKVSIPDSASLDVSTDLTLALTLIVTKDPQSVGHFSVIQKVNTDSDASWMMYCGYNVEVAGKRTFRPHIRTAGNLWRYGSINFDFTIGARYRLAYTYDSALGQMRGFVDGVEYAIVFGSTPVAGEAIRIGTAPLFLAEDTRGVGWFGGTMGGVRVYNRALTPQEIADDAKGVHKDETGLVARYEFEQGTGTLANDWSGKGNHGTLSGGVTWADPLVRARTASGTHWTRLLARNKHIAGRQQRLKRGFITEPWNWNTFQTEHGIIESIKGPDGSGRFRAQLSDTLRLLDQMQLPPPTDGKLAADLPAVSNSGVAQSATATTIRLAATASSVDDAYNGQEVLILQNTGAGQPRVITDYAGATRDATVAAWAVIPDTTSTYEVAPLSLTLEAGKGVQYPDPSGTGGKEFVRVKDEVIAYTAKIGDVLSWPDGTHRAQFGTARADAKANDGAQICEVMIDQPPDAAIKKLINRGGITDERIDLAGLATLVSDSLSIGTSICLGTPEKASDLLKELLADLDLLAWPDPVADLIRFAVNRPQLGSNTIDLTDDELRGRATQVDPLDAERLTRAALWFDRRSATANLREAKSFTRAAAYRDANAEGPNENNGVISETRYSRWLTAANALFVQARVARLVGRRRDTPRKVKFELDPRNEVEVGQLVTLRSRAIVGPDGAPIPVTVRITKKTDHLTHLALEARTTNFGQRYFFIAAPGLPDYGAATEAQRQYGYISNNGFMSDGSEGYRII